MAEQRFPALAVHDDWNQDVATVTVRGDIDSTTVDILSECLGRVAGRKPERLAIDLAQVGFLDSSAVHAFVRTRHMLPESCSVSLRSPSPQARKVFELTGLDSVCVIE